jgi:hypothetical protein
MDTLDGIEKLAIKARKKRVPVFDVSNQVIAQIRLREDQNISFFPFDLFATATAAAAAIAVFIGINAWTYIMNPLTQLFAPLQEVALW